MKKKSTKKADNPGTYTGITSEQRAAQEEAAFRKFEAGYGDRGILTARAAYEHAKFLDRARNPVKHTY